MRALVILALASGVAAAAPTGFDHNVHDRDVAIAGKETIACARCHPSGVARPDHRACFVTGCHGARPRVFCRMPARSSSSPTTSRRRCARPAMSSRAARGEAKGLFAVAYPPYSIGRDHALVLGHKSHAQVACAQCHTEAEEARAAARALHAGMPRRLVKGVADDGVRDAATSARPARRHRRSHRRRPPRLAPVKLAVTGPFSHARHAARGDAARACTTCHDDVLATDDSQLPRPTAATCAIGGCHDGKAAFATLTSCTRCHASEPAGWKDPRPSERFLHVKHDVTTCSACHTLGKTGEPVSAGHAACTNASCHRAEFGSPKPTICGACHNGTEPWRHLTPDRAPAPDTELGASLAHGKHGAPCTSCHALTTATTQLRPTRGHVTCTGSGCHAVTGGPAPQLSACTGCHELGLATARRVRREGATWSVRRAFDHDKHAASHCIECHVDLNADKVIDLATPPKATCAPCHDGKAAFKLTGTTCKKCHA